MPSRLIDWPKSLGNVARAELEAPNERPPYAIPFRCRASGNVDSDRVSSVGDRSSLVGLPGTNRKRAGPVVSGLESQRHSSNR